MSDMFSLPDWALTAYGTLRRVIFVPICIVILLGLIIGAHLLWSWLRGGNKRLPASSMPCGAM
jgi:hypothetical protein